MPPKRDCCSCFCGMKCRADLGRSKPRPYSGDSGRTVGLSAFWIPDWPQVQNKTGQLGISGNSLRIVQYLDDPGRPVDEHLTPFRVEEPAEAGAVRDVFFELVLEVCQAVRRGLELDYEVRTERKELFLFGNREALEP